MQLTPAHGSGERTSRPLAGSGRPQLPPTALTTERSRLLPESECLAKRLYAGGSASLLARIAMSQSRRHARAAAKPAKTCGAMRAAATARVRACGACGREAAAASRPACIHRSWPQPAHGTWKQKLAAKQIAHHHHQTQRNMEAAH